MDREMPFGFFQEFAASVYHVYTQRACISDVLQRKQYIS